MLVVALISNLPLIYGQFHGDDEAMQYKDCRRILDELRNWRGGGTVKEIVLLFSRFDHPPLRYALSLPGMVLFPGREVGLRLLAIVFSMVMALQVMRLGRDVAGAEAGLLGGLIVAGSAVHSWTSVGFAWSVMAVALVVCLRAVRSEDLDLAQRPARRAFCIANVCLIVAFTINTGSVLLTGAVMALYLFANRRRFARAAAWCAAFGVFYLAYYGYFVLFFPWYTARYGGATGAVGQLAHHLGRAAKSGPNVASLWDNLRGLNGHYLPYVAWLFFAAAAHYLWRKEKRILFVVLPFALAWSFWIRGNSHQYIVVLSVCLVPYGVAWLKERTTPRLFRACVGSFIGGCLVWNVWVFVWPYAELRAPTGALQAGLAVRGYPFNVARPYRQVSRDLDALVAPGDEYVDDLGGSFRMYYHNSSIDATPHARWAGRVGSDAFPLERLPDRAGPRLLLGSASRVRAAVTREALCEDQVERALTYPGSSIKLYVLKRPESSDGRVE